MSDQKSSFGEPVDEPKDVDGDVVGRAHEGLADAEAARADAARADAERIEADRAEADRIERDRAERDRVEPDRGEGERVESSEPVVVEPEHETATVVEPVANTPESRQSEDAGTTPWYERQDEDEARWAAYAASADTDRTETTVAPTLDETPTVVAAPAVAATEARATENPAVFPAGQPIFVQAPEAPHPRGNRGAAGAIGLLAALAFAVLYLAASLGFGLLYGDITVDGFLDATLAALTTASLWVPVVVFYLAFCLLGAIINRGRWGHWVVWGLLVGVASWLGHILGELIQAPFWMLTAREGATLIEEQILAPLAIVAFVLGRELTIWFGAWVAARGRRVTEINNEAQREYERTLEAGPQFQRA